MGKEKRQEKYPRNKLSAHFTQDMKRNQLKPITEKIRRERINNSLHELKNLVLIAMNKNVLQYAKMEKADIQDMAVKYIKFIQTAKQESKDGSVGPTQGNHQAPLVISPGKGPISTNISHRQSSSPDIDCESSWSRMIGLVEPKVAKPHQAYATMATPKNNSSSSFLADYALIPSSLNNDIFQPNTDNARESYSPTCNTKIGFPLLSSQSMENFSVTSKLRSPLAEKSDNVFSTVESTDNKKLFPTNFGKRQNPSTEEPESVCLPGMECFVKDTCITKSTKGNRDRSV